MATSLSPSEYPTVANAEAVVPVLHPPPRDGPVILDMPAETMRQSDFKKISLYSSDGDSMRTLRADHLGLGTESLESVMFTTNLKAPKLVIDPGTCSFTEIPGKRPVTLPVHCSYFGSGNAPPPEDVFETPGAVLSRHAQEHRIDLAGLYEQMPDTTDPPAKLNEIVIGITGQAAFSIMGYALTGSSSSPASYFVVGATAIGFICTFIALTLKGAKKPAARILGKVGAMAAACAAIFAMGMFLPANTIWTTGIGIACLIAVVTVALA